MIDKIELEDNETIGYFVGRATSSRGFAYLLATALSFTTGFLSKGCERKEKREYDTDNTSIVSKAVGNEFSGELERTFLKVNRGEYYIPRTENGKLESFLQAEEIITELKSGNLVIRGTQYNLTAVGKGEIHVKK